MIARNIGLLYRLRYLLPFWLERQLYFFLIHSQITYCLLVWGTCSKTDMERISALQSRAARLLLPTKNEANIPLARTQSHAPPVICKNDL